jgi:hypothetical protein
MPGRSCYLGSATIVAVTGLLLAPTAAQAYIGPGPGLEFVPTFLSLLTWAGLATGAVLWWPIAAFIHRIRGTRSQSAKPTPEAAQQAENAGEPR